MRNCTSFPFRSNAVKQNSLVDIQRNLHSVIAEQVELREEGLTKATVIQLPEREITGEEVSAKAKEVNSLTIKGVTKPISLSLQISNAGDITVLKSEISINRTVFGIKYNSKSFFGNLGDQAIKNNFDLAFEMKLI